VALLPCEQFGLAAVRQAGEVERLDGVFDLRSAARQVTVIARTSTQRRRRPLQTLSSVLIFVCRLRHCLDRFRERDSAPSSANSPRGSLRPFCGNAKKLPGAKIFWLAPFFANRSR
jgi:hypothetical protein